MKTILIEIKNAIAITMVMSIVCCGLYPLIVYGAGQIFFSHKANGSLIVDKTGKVLGSELIGQNFSGAKYFHSRPSAAGAGYDATNSGGTNLGPTSQKLIDSVKAAAVQYRAENGMAADALVPADAVTSSASGLDPHISVANALLQAGRVAQQRKMSDSEIHAEIDQFTEGRQFGLLGEPAVNVLKLNLALDARP